MSPDGWSRLSPLTPLLRGGRFLTAVGAVLVQQGAQRPGPRVLAGLVLLGTLVALALGTLSWRATRYRLTGSELQIDSGVLRRRNRRVPLARVQSVDVVRPLVARVLGLAALRLEVVGGSDSDAPLAYLGEDEARRLRLRLLAGSDADDAVEAVEQVLVAVPTGVLVGSVLLGAPAVLAVVFAVLAVVVAIVDGAAAPAVLAPAVPLALATGGVAVRRLLTEYGFSVAESTDGLRLRHGLLETRTQTLLPGRVQAVRTSQPLLWRLPGWVRVEVDVAGYAGGRGEERAATSALLPVAPQALACALVARVLGGALPPTGEPAPPSARLRAPLSRRRLRVGLDDRHLVATSGVLTTTTDVLPLARVQSLRLVQGPLQRRLGLASVAADSAGRRLTGAVARHRRTAEAQALLAELVRRSRAARQESRTGPWPPG